jgi:hypothetical protein
MEVKLSGSTQVGTRFGLNEVIQINILTRQYIVMAPTGSYLISLTTISGASIVWDAWDSGGVHGLIQCICIYHGSNLLEDIDNYNLLAKMLHYGGTGPGAPKVMLPDRTSAIQQLVSLVGSLCSQNYLTLYIMDSAPFKLEIQLVDDLKKECLSSGIKKRLPEL